MEAFADIIGSVGTGFGYLLVVLLCVVGVVLSCLSISGTWSVLAAALTATLIGDGGFPGWKTVVGFAVVCIAVEVVEFLAGYWGITRKGGSRAAGGAAVVGGLIGLVLGGFIPVFIIGNLAGMLIGSFVLAFLVERERIRKTAKAAEVAFGAVLARIWVLFFKVLVTMGMVFFLVAGLLRS